MIRLQRDETSLDVEYGERDGFQVGKAAALSDWAFNKEKRDFNKLIAVLRATKWNKEHLERHRAHALAYSSKPEVMAKSEAARRARIIAAHRANPEIFTCLECGSQWCLIKPRRGPIPEFCTDAHRQRHRYQERTPGARRIKPGGGRPRRAA
jgi:hypothetical protein